MTGKRRVAFTALLATLGCLEPIEPTPDSAPLSITPQVETSSVEKLGGVYSFSVPLHVKNTGGRPVVIDLYYRRTEKLVDQKWQLAAESAPSGLLRTVNANQIALLQYVVSYRIGAGYPLLEHGRGVYRVGLRAVYADDGTSLEPAPSYSRPFVLVDNSGN